MLDSKTSEAISMNDTVTIQSILHLLSIMQCDSDFLLLIITQKLMPIFQSLKQLKQIALGPIAYYFESLHGFINIDI